jgi:hypothetical protein
MKSLLDGFAFSSHAQILGLRFADRLSEIAIPAARHMQPEPRLEVLTNKLAAVQFESSHFTIAMGARKPASLKAMLPQPNMM